MISVNESKEPVGRREGGRVVIAEAHPVARANLARAWRRVALEVHVASSWRSFNELLDGLEQLRLVPDIVVLGDGFAAGRDGEALVKERFPSSRVLRLGSIRRNQPAQQA
jgi:hypothetical protein